MQTTAELIQILTTINNEIVEDLERYTNQPEAKSYIINKLNNQINKIEFCINLLTEETDNKNKQAEKQKAKEKQKTLLIDKLQIICLLHGIDDLGFYLQWSHKMLLNELQIRRNPQPTIENYVNTTTQTNKKFWELVGEIKKLETIKTIQMPLGHLIALSNYQYLGTTNKPITIFK